MIVEELLPKKIGPYTLRSTLGEGASSMVKLVKHDETDAKFACKIFQKSYMNEISLERFEKEIRIQQQLHHPNIVDLIDLYQDELYYYIIIDYCPRDLFQDIVEKGKFQEYQAAIIMKQVFEALQFLHSLNIAHRDLKPENILMDDDGKPKISDFGLSRYVANDHLTSTPCGSPSYASPECLGGNPYDALKSDCWSCGVILYIMVVGELPWVSRNQTELMNHIEKGQFTVPSFVSPRCQSLIEGLMNLDPTSRLSISDCLQHPFITSIVDNNYFNPINRVDFLSLKKIDEFFHREDSIPDFTIAEASKETNYTISQVLRQIIPPGSVPVRHRKRRARKQ